MTQNPVKIITQAAESISEVAGVPVKCHVLRSGLKEHKDMVRVRFKLNFQERAALGVDEDLIVIMELDLDRAAYDGRNITRQRMLETLRMNAENAVMEAIHRQIGRPGAVYKPSERF